MSDWTPAGTPPASGRNVVAYSRGEVRCAWFDGIYWRFNSEEHDREVMHGVEVWCELPDIARLYSSAAPKCKDCRFFSWYERGYCIHPNYVSVDSPDIAIVSWSSVIRESGAVNACGPEGKLFEAAK